MSEEMVNIITHNNNINDDAVSFLNCKIESKDITRITSKKIIDNFKPSIIFHLAAQPLIYESYKRPHLTFDVNFRGSLNIVDSSFLNKSVRSVIVVTSDKCYESNNSTKGFKENDLLGGVDPYSASKAVTEIMVRAYRKSFSKNREWISNKL